MVHFTIANGNDILLPLLTERFSKEGEDEYIEMETSIDCVGRIVMRSKEKFFNANYPLIKTKDISSSVEEKDSKWIGGFLGTDFICIDKHDGCNILKMLTDVIEAFSSTDEEDDGYPKDVKVFGDKAISYERLFDYLGYANFCIDGNPVDYINHQDYKSLFNEKGEETNG